MIEQYLTSIPNQNSRNAYARDLTIFADWLGTDPLAELTPADLLGYIVHLQGRGDAPTTINRRLSAVRAFLRWAALTGQIKPEVYSAAQVVSGVKTPQSLPHPLTPSEVERLLAQPDLGTLSGARDLAFVKLALATGCRLSELIEANVEDVDWERRRLLVEGKGSKERIVLFTEDTAAALVYYLAQRGSPMTGPLFLNKRNERLSNRWVQRTIAEYGTAAGIKELHPHTLRHSFATELLDRTGDLDAVSKLLGHANINTTRIYTGLATARLERIYREAMEPAHCASREAPMGEKTQTDVRQYVLA